MVSFDLAVMNTASLADAALAYARAGLPVFPLAPGGKQPIVAHGFYRATTDLTFVRRWWKEQPLANIGVACGKPSDWWVLDIDPRHGGWEALEQLQHALDQETSDRLVSGLLHATRRQRTGGDGVHLIFRRRADLAAELTTMPNFAGYQGIDFKGDRGYILVSPSVHPSGKRYQWLNDQPLVPFPDALYQRWIIARQQHLASFTSSARRSPNQLRGHQGFHANEPGSYLHYAVSQGSVERLGLTWDQAVPWMLEYVSRVPQCGHPYTEREALNALAWAFRQRSAA
jgi:hypothetical protein